MEEHKETSRPPGKLPPWLRKRLPAAGASRQVARVLKDLGLSTVCTAAACPNLGECHARGTATFLIMGDRCTRDCRFCAIDGGRPLPLREDEPAAVAQACERMGLAYVVLTSVTRDDLADGGAEHFARTIHAIRERLPAAKIEVLTPDFQGRQADIDTVLAAGPDVFDHNVETVPRLYASVRPARTAPGPAPDYPRSLNVLSYVKSRSPHLGHRLLVKSGLMLGLGESDEEIRAVLGDLRTAGVDILTLGQYLAPSSRHCPVGRFVEPAEFARWEAEARQMGFPAVLAGPFVRSSYHAEELIVGD
ncbi:MAG: lipoyl synthase [Phycisphaerae bacterium]|jgi:lipoic acid synthetase